MPQTLTRLGQRVFATGNTIRQVAQWPVLARLLREAPGGTALDLGAGGGIHSCGLYTFGLLAPRYPKVIALDYSAPYCRVLRQRARAFPGVRVLRASGERLPLPAASVDLVLCAEVLTYLPDDACGLNEIARALKPRGAALLSVPLLPEPCPVPGALRAGYTEGQFVAMVERAGLRVEAAAYCLFALSRLVMRLSCPLWRHSAGRWPLPLLWLIWLERWGAQWGRPYDLVLRARRP